MSFGAIVGGVVAAGASMAGSMMSADAAGDAANAQIAAQREANASNEKIANQQIQYLKQSRDQANAMQRPFANIGLNAQNRLAYMLGLGNTAYDFNDQYGAEKKPFEYSWNNWVSDNKVQLDKLMKAKPKVGTTEYKTWQKKVSNINLNMNEGSNLAKSAYERWKKSKEEMYNKAPNNQPMYKSRKVPVNKTYGSLMKDFTLQDFRADPGYNFRMQQGNQQLNNQLSAMGLRESGRALKEGLRFSQGLADQTYNDAFNRYNINRQNKYNFLSGVGGSGQQAAQQIASNANSFGAGASNVLGNQMQLSNQNIVGQGDSRAAGLIGQGNAWNQGISSIGSSFGMMAGLYGGGGGGGVVPIPRGGGGGGNRYPNLENAGFMA